MTDTALENYTIHKRFIGLCLASGCFSALVTAIGGVIVRHVIVNPEDPFTAVLAYLTLGAWVGVIAQYFTSNRVGRWISPGFTGIRRYNLRLQRDAFISGTVSSVATMFSIWGSQMVDPGMIVVLGNVATLYLIAHDVRKKRVLVADIVSPTALVLIGSALASLASRSGFNATALGVIVLLTGRSGLEALARLVDRDGLRKEMDPINYAFWRFVWLALSGTLLALALATVRGQAIRYGALVAGRALPALPILILLMILVTFANGADKAAQRTGEASQVSLLLTMQAVAIVPILVLGDALWPGLFGQIPNSSWSWLMRLTGSLLVVWGVIRLRRAGETKTKNGSEKPTSTHPVGHLPSQKM